MKKLGVGAEGNYIKEGIINSILKYSDYYFTSNVYDHYYAKGIDYQLYEKKCERGDYKYIVLCRLI